jgi:hypothetical protein
MQLFITNTAIPLLARMFDCILYANIYQNASGLTSTCNKGYNDCG